MRTHSDSNVPPPSYGKDKRNRQRCFVKSSSSSSCVRQRSHTTTERDSVLSGNSIFFTSVGAQSASTDTFDGHNIHYNRLFLQANLEYSVNKVSKAHPLFSIPMDVICPFLTAKDVVRLSSTSSYFRFEACCSKRTSEDETIPCSIRHGRKRCSFNPGLSMIQKPLVVHHLSNISCYISVACAEHLVHSIHWESVHSMKIDTRKESWRRLLDVMIEHAGLVDLISLRSLEIDGDYRIGEFATSFLKYSKVSWLELREVTQMETVAHVLSAQGVYLHLEYVFVRVKFNQCGVDYAKLCSIPPLPKLQRLGMASATDSDMLNIPSDLLYGILRNVRDPKQITAVALNGCVLTGKPDEVSRALRYLLQLPCVTRLAIGTESYLPLSVPELADLRSGRMKDWSVFHVCCDAITAFESLPPSLDRPFSDMWDPFFSENSMYHNYPKRGVNRHEFIYPSQSDSRRESVLCGRSGAKNISGLDIFQREFELEDDLAKFHWFDTLTEKQRNAYDQGILTKVCDAYRTAATRKRIGGSRRRSL